jgi:multidrug transporter EmrE-like cation transporter
LAELLRPVAESGATPRTVVFAVLVVAILFSTTGELLLKIGIDRVGEFALAPGPMLRAVTNPIVILGFSLFGVGALFWLWVISRAPLSWAYPMLALGYMLVVIESRLILGESVPAQRWVGALVIVLGVIVMYYSAPADGP